MITSYGVINNVYNHFLPSVRPKSSRTVINDTKELEDIYNTIRKSYKDSPIYLIDNSKEARESSVEFKDNITSFNQSINDILDKSKEQIIRNYRPISSDENIAKVRFKSENAREMQSLELSVTNLARKQINIGKPEVGADKANLTPGKYTFGVKVSDMSYELPLTVERNETNDSLQSKVISLVNNSKIGLEASALSDSTKKGAIKIESLNTGVIFGKERTFQFENASFEGEKDDKLLEYLGINDMVQAPSNSRFSINGEARITASNTFLLNNDLEITLTGTSGRNETKAIIDTQIDIDEMKEGLTKSLDKVNEFTGYLSEYARKHPKAYHLLKDLNASYYEYKSEFNNVGISKDDSSNIAVDDKVLESIMKNENEYSRFDFLKDYYGKLEDITKDISIKPMQFNETKIVDYKDMKSQFYPAYITSAYSGYLFNSYC